MFGWIAVHVHAHKLQIMSHKVLVSPLDEESRTSSVDIAVPLTLDKEARTNGTYNEIAKSKIMVEVENLCSLCVRLWVYLAAGCGTSNGNARTTWLSWLANCFSSSGVRWFRATPPERQCIDGADLQLAAHPDASDVMTRMIAAASLIMSVVQTPFLFICDVTMGYNPLHPCVSWNTYTLWRPYAKQSTNGTFGQARPLLELHQAPPFEGVHVNLSPARPIPIRVSSDRSAESGLDVGTFLAFNLAFKYTRAFLQMVRRWWFGYRWWKRHSDFGLGLVCGCMISDILDLQDLTGVPSARFEDSGRWSSFYTLRSRLWASILPPQSTYSASSYMIGLTRVHVLNLAFASCLEMRLVIAALILPLTCVDEDEH
ncbi:hypothetical protein M405DRAFT_920723 [Rhizopogon salebrosus TDB-379]|nr:hypothetical protein M405DRAFT_920723 [Rhizopogon salebrosus TDB-379]